MILGIFWEESKEYHLKIKILLFLFIYFLSIHTLYAFNPCNENISQKDKDSFKALELNLPLFQCSFTSEQSLWQYNQTLQKDYDTTLKELQSNFPTLSLSQAKGLRYAIYIQDSLNVLKKGKDKETSTIIGRTGSLAFTQKDLMAMQKAINMYYQEAITSLNPTQIQNLSLKLYGEANALATTQQAKDSKTFTKEQIAKAKEDNTKILQQIQDIMNLDFKSESEVILYVDIVNNLAFMYNANLLINEGKDYQERQHKAYDDSKALELLELLSIFIDKIQNTEYQFIALQGSLITIQEAIMSTPTHTPFTKEDYERFNAKEELKYYSKIIQIQSFKTITKNLEKVISQASQATYYQKRAVFQKTFTKLDSILKTLEFFNSQKGVVYQLKLSFEYEDTHLKSRKNDGK